MKKLKTFISLFPKTVWIVLILAILIRPINYEYLKFSNVLLNFISFNFFVKLSIIIHEIGHLVFGKLVGGKPLLFSIGNSNEAFRFKLLNVYFSINFPLASGSAFVSFDTDKITKIKYSLYLFGGLFFNIVATLIVYFLFDFRLDFFSGENGVEFSSVFIVVNLYLIVLNIIPQKSKLYGINTGNDGFSIYETLFKSIDKEFLKDNKTFEFGNAYECYLNRDYENALMKFRELYKNSNDSFSYVNMAVMLIELSRFEESLELLSKCEEILSDVDYKQLESIINHNIAWIYFVKDEIELSIEYSEKTYKNQTIFLPFHNLRANLLIESEKKVIQGRNILLKRMNANIYNSINVVMALYIAYSYYLTKNFKKQKKYFKFVEANLGELKKSDMILYNRIKSKMENAEEEVSV